MPQVSALKLCLSQSPDIPLTVEISTGNFHDVWVGRGQKIGAAPLTPFTQMQGHLGCRAAAFRRDEMCGPERLDFSKPDLTSNFLRASAFCPQWLRKSGSSLLSLSEQGGCRHPLPWHSPGSGRFSLWSCSLLLSVLIHAWEKEPSAHPSPLQVSPCTYSAHGRSSTTVEPSRLGLTAPLLWDAEPKAQEQGKKSGTHQVQGVGFLCLPLPTLLGSDAVLLPPLNFSHIVG